MYPIPDLGESENPNGKVIKDLRINNVEMKIQDTVLVIYIGLYHPDLGHRYAIDIVCPVNYNGLSADGMIDPVIPPPSPQLPDPSNPIEPSPSPSPSPSSSPSAAPSMAPSPSPSSSPTPGVEDVVTGTACERSGDSICWFYEMGFGTADLFANGSGITNGNYDFDVTVLWTRTGVNWECWGTGVKGFGWWSHAKDTLFPDLFGGYRCWQGSECYNYLKSKQTADVTPHTIGGIYGTIQRCDCYWGESC